MSTERGKSKAPSGSEHAHARDRRCDCGKLAARVTAEGVEIKCSRCKRVMVVSWKEVPKDGSFFSVTDD
jgi:phage FluMu protein Com